MEHSHKGIEEYWLGVIGSCLPQPGFPWTTSDRKSGHLVSVTREIPVTAVTGLQQVSGNNETATQLLFLSIWKLILYKYTHERNCLVNCFTDNGIIPIVTGIEPAAPFKTLINTVKDDYLRTRELAFTDMTSLTDKYKIRHQQDIAETFNRFAFRYNSNSLNEVLDAHQFVCEVRPGDKTYVATFKCFSTVDWMPSLLDVLMENFVATVNNIRTYLTLPMSQIDIRSEVDRMISEHSTSGKKVTTAMNGKTLHQIFETSASRYPDHIAVVHEQQSITYKELNCKVNQLAHVLIGRGITPNAIVGILADRSIDMIVGLLAILKAGGTYLPVDPKYPAERKQYMLEDSGTQWLLTDKPEISYDGIEVIVFDEIVLAQQEVENPHVALTDAAGAYIIYTSGTTGKPKGVLITHRNVISLFSSQDHFMFDDSHIWSFFHSFCFDFSVWEMYGALLYGGRLVVLSGDTIIDPAMVADVLRNQRVNVLCQTPTYFYNLLQELVPTNREPVDIAYIIFGGEALNLSKLKPWVNRYPDTKLINMYGITETTIHTTYKHITPTHLDRDISNIGCSLPHLKIYLLNEELQQVPTGASGEIFVSGAGVAGGYLNKPALTAERFIRLPACNSEEVLYRSGDVARQLPDGDLEYVGRRDNQVKINGFRIELEEVEAQLLDTGIVKDAVVVVREYNGAKCLCAYFSAIMPVDILTLRDALESRLPHYMIPACFLQLDQLPLTINGKKDKNLLPDIKAAIHKEVHAPQTIRELVLANAWKRILGGDAISIDDEFYASGGDSIKAIQLKAALANEGYGVEIANILRLRTFRDIAAGLTNTLSKAEQGTISGEIPLHPVQARFIQMNAHAVDHSLQAILLDMLVPVSEKQIREIFAKLMEHHDALRLQLILSSTGSYQQIIRPDATLSIETIDLADDDTAEILRQEMIVALQKSFDIGTGPCLKLALFFTGNHCQLLICVHHLAIDGVSWRILLSDFQLLYEQQQAVLPLQLPQKTHSIRHWNQYLSDIVNTEPLQQEYNYWRNLCASKTLFSYEGHLLEQDFSRTVQAFDAVFTHQLTAATHHAYQTNTQDLLIAALYLAIKQQFPDSRGLMLNLEQHGRDVYPGDAELGRTIGWFTSVFPVAVNTPVTENVSDVIIAIKDMMREIPGKGAGYGILRYLSSVAVAEKDALAYHPDIEFNFLGQLNTPVNSHLMAIKSYAPGVLRNAAHRHAAPLIINILIDEAATLQIELLYNKHVLSAAEVASLSEMFSQKLRTVVEHCVSRHQREYTNSDFTCRELSREKINELVTSFDVEDIYPLTPVQEGILFHHLLSTDKKVYFEQVSYTYAAPLKVELLFESLDKLADRHDLLRALFIHHEVRRPVQLIRQHNNIQRQFEDISDRSAIDQQQYIQALKIADQEKGFVLEDGSLIRLYLLQTGTERYCFIWSFHHLIMDGWCLDIVKTELFAIYHALVAEREVDLLPAPEYRDFIKWLAARDMNSSREFWKNFLNGYTRKLYIPILRTRDSKQASFASRKHTIDVACETRLRQIAAANNVAVNHLLQVSWGIVLNRYGNTNDVLFGLVVAGRPAIIPNIDRMIGMFINTIPQRLVFDKDGSVIRMAEQLQELAVASLPHQHYPLTELQKNIGKSGDLFDHILNYINYPLADRILLTENDNTATEGEIGAVEVFEQTHYDFSVNIVDNRQLTIRFDYNERKYDTYIIDQLFAGFLTVIEQISAGIDNTDNISILPPDFLQCRTIEMSSTLPANLTTMQALFEARVAHSPFSVAIANDIQQITYRQLDELSTQLAAHINDAGIPENAVVAIVADRSLDTIIGILGILKAGCIYLPVEADYPTSRIMHMLQDAAAAAVISRKVTWEYLRENGFEQSNWIDTSFTRETVGVFRLENACHHPWYDPDLAYILYTSGSTGLPKGVLIKHSSVVNFITSQQACFNIRETDCILQFSSLCFDTSIEEIFLALYSGAKLLLCDKHILLDADKFVDYANKHQVSVIHTVPSFVATLTPGVLRDLRILIVGGDVCPVNIAEKWQGCLDFYNSYGPTETTVSATQMQIHKSSPYCYTVPIGMPAAGAQVFILDRCQRLCPIGVEGEIYIGGKGVSAGYINREELNSERFVDHSLAVAGKLYRTGDIGRCLPDGTIEFIGRADRQVKIRGHRIEPGEIEYHIGQFHPFEGVIVQPLSRPGAGDTLVAYIQTDIAVDKLAIRKYLLELIPEYMVPSRFVMVNEIPLNYNGKVDTGALKDLLDAMPQVQVDYTMFNDTQRILAGIWRETLQVDTVGIDDNFFELGGSSIDMITISSKLKTHFGMEDMLIKMFHYSTIQSLAEYIDLKGKDVGKENVLREEFSEANDELRERRLRKRNLRN